QPARAARTRGARRRRRGAGTTRTRTRSLIAPTVPRRVSGWLLVAAFAVAPPPNVALPSSPARVAKALTETQVDLDAAIAHWAPKSAPAPRDVVLYALYEQRLYRLLAREAKLADATLPKLPGSLRATTRDLLVAHRELYRPAAAAPGRHSYQGRPCRSGVVAARLLPGGAAALPRALERPRIGQLRRIEVRQVAQPERVGRARSDAVHAGDVGTLRTGWERARRTRCDPRRCELPARVRCTTGHASRAACIQPLAGVC